MTLFVFANNVNTQLAGAISGTSTSLTLASTYGLPSSIPAGYYLALTLNDAATKQNFEIVYATAISGATLSGLLRAQEGTSALSWGVGDFAYNPPTAGQMHNFFQLSQATGRLLSPPTIITAGGTFTPNPLANYRVFEGSAGGGAGGGTQATSSTQCSVGSGGNSGAYLLADYAGTLSGTFTAVIGAGGVGVVGGTGGTGGVTSFIGTGISMSLPGGLGGLASTATPPPFFGSGNSDTAAPTVSGARIILALAGCAGGGAFGLTLNAATNSPGRGNSNPLGLAPNQGYGTGGNGGSIGSSSSATAGTNGFIGVWRIWEYS
jgi:hypothetical protein